MPLTMYTTQWCGFCRRLKAQLGRAGVEVNEVDIEHDAAAAEFVMSVNGGNQTVPTLLFPTARPWSIHRRRRCRRSWRELAATTAS